MRAASSSDGRPTLLISPCSSHTARNWSAERYAAVADHAAAGHRMARGAGGRTQFRGSAHGQRRLPRAARTPLVNQIGKDTLPQLLGLMSQSTVLLSPDSGPAHMASMVGLPVIGLYAATNPQRAGPYYSREWCVDKYDAAARKFLGKPAAQHPVDDKNRTARRHGLDCGERCHGKIRRADAGAEFSLRCRHERH